MKWQVYDLHTKQYIGKQYTDISKAYHKADRLNLEYGAHRYSVKAV